jgi:hypothetical protein
LTNIARSWVVLAVPGKPVEPGLFEAGLALFADGFASSLVFVVGGDVADAGVQAATVVVLAGVGEFGAQRGRVADGEQVRVLGLDLPVEAFDPGLVDRGAGGDRSAGRSRTAP